MSECTYEYVIDRTRALVEARGNSAGYGLLMEFGVRKLLDLDPKYWGDFVRAANGLIEFKRSTWGEPYSRCSWFVRKPAGLDSDPELVALQTRPQHVEASCEEEKPVKSLGALLREKLKQMEESGTIDRERAPLPYFTGAKRFDPFSDFIVHHREEVSVNAKPFANLSLDGCEQFRAPRSI